MSVLGDCACDGESPGTHAQLKHNRLEHPVLGLLQTRDAFAIAEQPATGCQAVGKAVDSRGSTQLCP